MVEVLDEEANRSYYFNCNKWLGLGIGDNLLERTLVAEDEDPRHQFTTYKLDFFTSTLRGAGTDATIYFQLFGDKVRGGRVCHLLRKGSPPTSSTPSPAR